MDHRRSHPALIASASLIALTGSTALAQETNRQQASDVSEVVVTATRREEALSKVPLSVVALSQERMDRQGIRSVDDIVRLTPDIQFQPESAGNRGVQNNIAIRGIFSPAGVATTGLYIDDTQIAAQFRRDAASTYPLVFDLARVEVLRGPQGTLFGSGSMGGAIRWITPTPSLTQTSVYARAEASATRYGAPAGELGFAVGGPLVEDKVGFRVSAWGRHQGGYIDRVDFNTDNTIERNINSQDAGVARAALLFQVNDNLRISPSVYYQVVKGYGNGSFNPRVSDPDSGLFHNTDIDPSKNRDRFVLPAIKAEATFGDIDFIGTVSYFDRQYTNSHSLELIMHCVINARIPGICSNPTLAPPGSSMMSHIFVHQAYFIQEARLQSVDPERRLTWVAGLYHSDTEQHEYQDVSHNRWEDLVQQQFGMSSTQRYGVPLYLGQYIVYTNINTAIDQWAGFAQGDYRITDQLKATAGVRVSSMETKYNAANLGPFFGSGQFAKGSAKETAVTPKFGLTFQVDDNNMLYANAAKGFRPGGYQTAIATSVCGGDLAQIGLSSSPTEYKSDTLWSYELGSKNKLFGGRVSVDVAAYYIDWSNIQITLTMPTCRQSFLANAATARVKGVDYTMTFAPTDNLTLGVQLGYTDAEYTKPIILTPSGGAPRNIVVKGQKLIPSPFSATVSADYRFEIGGHPAYVRGDYQYRAKGNSRNLAVFGADPAIPNDPELNLVNARAGVVLGNFDVSVFVNNLTDAHPIYISRNTPTSVIFLNRTITPRTVGVTGVYRY